MAISTSTGPSSPRTSPSEPGRHYATRPRRCTDSSPNRKVTWPGSRTWSSTPPPWATHPTCYLEDLYVAKPWRGAGIARQLIEAVFTFADGFGVAGVYWLTQEYNAPARSLYDTLAHRTSFVVYQR